MRIANTQAKSQDSSGIRATATTDHLAWRRTTHLLTELKREKIRGCKRESAFQRRLRRRVNELISVVNS
jgi:hypothetical protein